MKFQPTQKQTLLKIALRLFVVVIKPACNFFVHRFVTTKLKRDNDLDREIEVIGVEGLRPDLMSLMICYLSDDF